MNEQESDLRALQLAPGESVHSTGTSQLPWKRHLGWSAALPPGQARLPGTQAMGWMGHHDSVRAGLSLPTAPPAADPGGDHHFLPACSWDEPAAVMSFTCLIGVPEPVSGPASSSDQ